MSIPVKEMLVCPPPPGASVCSGSPFCSLRRVVQAWTGVASVCGYSYSMRFIYCPDSFSLILHYSEFGLKNSAWLEKFLDHNQESFLMFLDSTRLASLNIKDFSNSD